MRCLVILGYSAAAILALILFYFFLSPWLFGLPGRNAEARYAAAIKVGMSRDEVVKLDTETNAADYGTPLRDRNVEDPPGTLHAYFADYILIPCFASGTAYSLYFDSDNHLRSWRSDPWSDGC